MKKGITKKVYQAIEAIEGRTASEALNAMYVNGTTPMRAIWQKWGINNRTLMRMFKELGITVKDRSESVKNQWVGNKGRRESQSNMFKEIRATTPHPMLGKKHPVASKRMKEFNPMFDQPTKDRAAKTRKQVFKDDPTKYGMHHKELTQCEQIVFDFLTERGIRCIGNEHINGRFIDVFLPDFNIGIECINYSRFPLGFDRHKQITETGVHVVYAVNNFIKSKNLYILYDYIINPNVFGLSPTRNSQETMVFCRTSGAIFSGDTNQFPTKIISVNGCNVARIATTANN